MPSPTLYLVDEDLSDEALLEGYQFLREETSPSVHALIAALERAHLELFRAYINLAEVVQVSGLADRVSGDAS